MPRPLPLLPHPTEEEWTKGCGIVLEDISIIGTAHEDALRAAAERDEDMKPPFPPIENGNEKLKIIM